MARGCDVIVTAEDVGLGLQWGRGGWPADDEL